MIDRHRTRGAQSTVAFFLVILIIIASISQWLDISIVTGSFQSKFPVQDSPHIYSQEFDCSLNCSQISHVITNTNNPSTNACPEYFRWIHEDLRPWKNNGITMEAVEKAKEVAHIRIIIVNGRLFTEKYKKAFQTRDIVTIWGILQLLRPEVNIKPWEELKEDIKEGNKRIKWENRQPYAYWKGNSKLGAARHDLVKCNASEGQDWKARIFGMDWHEEKKQGFKSSDLASQCTYRYKIYVEGVSWSVSQKYILACDSMTLIVKPRFYDFFTRSLLPLIHYWPISEKNKCESIKFAVEWGNNYTDKARDIGKGGSRFVQENLAMEYVYDYTYHLLNEYAKLLRYKPTVPRGAVETCSESLVCSVRGQKRRFMKHSMVKNPSGTLPCDLPPSHERAALHDFSERKENLTRQVASWERSLSIKEMQ